MIVSNVPAQLKEYGCCLIQTTGTSMEPMLHHRKSSVILEKPTRPLQEMDVVLFRLGEMLVLHRIVKIRNGICYICGDNTLNFDAVPEGDILGVMTGYYPDETDAFLPIEDPEYRRYVKQWHLRHAKLWVKTRLKLVGHGLKISISELKSNQSKYKSVKSFRKR